MHSQCLGYQKKKNQIVMIQEKLLHLQGKGQTDINLEMIQMLKLSNRDFKEDFITMLCNRKANVLLINKSMKIIRKTCIYK